MIVVKTERKTLVVWDAKAEGVHISLINDEIDVDDAGRPLWTAHWHRPLELNRHFQPQPMHWSDARTFLAHLGFTLPADSGRPQ